MVRFLSVAILALAGAALIENSTPAGGEKMLKPVNLGKVNTKGDEDDPFILSNNQSLLYASKTEEYFDIMISHRKGKTWLAGKPVPGLHARAADCRSPFVSSRDGKLYFATNEVPDEKLKDLKNFDIKVRVGERAPLIIPGISEKEDELHPWITPGGKEFYFSRRTKEGWVLMVARGPVPGPIGNPKPVGFAPGFHHATLTNSGLIMYLQGPLEKDRSGLFRSRRTRVGAAWSEPEPLVNLNSPDGPRGDMSPCVSGDGKRLLFASDRPGGVGGLDLWVVETAQLKTSSK